MLGVKCVHPETAAEIQRTFVSLPRPGICVVPPARTNVSDKLQLFSLKKKQKQNTVYMHSFVAASEKRGQEECGCASARTYV